MDDGYYPQTIILTGKTALLADVLIQSGEYYLNPPFVPQGVPQKGANSLVILPGLVDLYSRSGEPGFEARETLASLKHCARAGGFSRVAIMPYKPIDRLEMVDYFSSHAPFLLWGALTDGEKLYEYRDLENRVVGFAHNQPIKDLLLLRRALEYLAPLKKPVLLLPQHAQLAQGVMTEGFYSLKFGLAGIPPCAETIGLAAIIHLLRLTHCPVHVMGITYSGSIPLIEQAKHEGLPITASVMWTHLLWNSADLGTYNPHLKLNPPLPNPLDQKELIKAIKNTTIDVIAINHAPYTYEEKMIPFEVAPPGTIGLQFAFSLLWSNLVETKQLTPIELIQALRIKPAQILGIDPPSEAFAFLPKSPWYLDDKTSASLAQNTIMWQQKINGKIAPLANFAQNF